MESVEPAPRVPWSPSRMRTNQAARGCATHLHLRLLSFCISIPGRASCPWRLTIHHVRDWVSQVWHGVFGVLGETATVTLPWVIPVATVQH